MKFLRNRETGKVLAWWDFELEIKAAGKEPVISYASKGIAEKYGANIVSSPKGVVGF